GGEEDFAPTREGGAILSRKRPGRHLRAWLIVLVGLMAVTAATSAAVSYAAGSDAPPPAMEATALPGVEQAGAGVSPSPTAPPEMAPWGWLVMDGREGGRDRLWAYRPGSIAFIPLAAGAWNDRHPAAGPDGHSIAFTSDRDGPWDIYVLDGSSGEVRRLTDTLAYEGWPSWSPDGRWLAVESYADGDLDIWVLSVDGSSPPIQLTNESSADYAPAWDPQGRRIAFISDRAGQPDLYLADLDITDEGRFRNLTNTALAEERDPVFNPSGDALAYASTEDGIDDLLMIDWTDNGRVSRIGQGVAPVWSPNGSLLLSSVRGANRRSAAVYQVGPSDPGLPSVPPSAAHQRATWLPAESRLQLPEVPEGLPTEVDVQLSGSDPAPARVVLAPLTGIQAPNPQLSERAVAGYRVLRERVAADSGWDLLSKLANAFVGLNDPMPPGWEHASWLKTGRAFSFVVEPYRAGWVEIVREDIGAETYWRVFLRAANQDGTAGEPLRSRPWDLDARYHGDAPVYDQGGAPKPAVPSGYYLDFTALAADLGFERLAALPNWRRYYPGARFNEFVLRQALSWEQAMLELYPAAAIATPTPFRTPTLTPTATLRPTPTSYWWRWRTPAPSPLPTITPTAILP
ncbi:MAG: hypothetical protein MUO23_04205, partial [Anaerolineales bacterium]|nr:hypothetical protein [Anaerolineales bacterium]